MSMMLAKTNTFFNDIAYELEATIVRHQTIYPPNKSKTTIYLKHCTWARTSRS